MAQVRVKGIGLVDIPEGATREDIAAILAKASGTAPAAPETSPLGHLWEAQKGLWSGVASGVAAIPEGIGAVTGSQGLKDIGQYIRDNEITANFAPNPGYEGSIPRQAGEIAGNIATMVGPGVGASALKAPAMASRGVGALMGMMQGAAEQKREADRNRLEGMDITPEQETEASRWGAATGMLDFLPVGRLLKPIEHMGGMAGARELVKATRGEILKDIAKTGLTESATEMLQQGAQNLIEQKVYNPSQELGEGVLESGIAGAGAGAGLDALIGGIARRIGRKANVAAENVRARQTAPEILPGEESAIGIRSNDIGEADIRYVEAIAKAGTGKPMAELDPESQKIIAQRAAELKLMGIPEQDAIALMGEEPVASEPAPTPISLPEQIQQAPQPPSHSTLIEEVVPESAKPTDIISTENKPPFQVAENTDVPITPEIAQPEADALPLDQPGAPKFSLSEEPVVRIYRAETTGNESKGVPDWIKETSQYKATKDASRRWFTDDPAEADWYLKNMDGTHIVYADVPRSKIDSMRVSNLPEGHPAKKYSRRPEKELFVSREIADSASPIEKFSISNAVTDTPKLSVTQLRKQVEAGEKPQIALDIFSEMRRLGMDDIVSTRLVDTLSTPNAKGKYADQIISLAMASQSPQQLKATLNHEAVHAMKQLGLFNDTEWQILQTALNPNAILSGEERRQYKTLYGDNPNLIQEEAVARGLERYSDGSLDLGGDAQRIIGQKIGVLDRLGNLFKSKGMDTPESVGVAFREGKIGKRNLEGPAIPQQNADTVTLFDDDDTQGYADETVPPKERLSIQQQPVTGRIFAPPDPRTPLKKQWDETVNPPPVQPGQPNPLTGKLRQNALDSRAGIESLSRKAGDIHDAKTSAIAAVRNADQAANFSTASLTSGAMEFVGTPGNGYFRARENGPHPYGKGGFFTKAREEGVLDRTMHYLAGSRAEKLMAEGREKLLTTQQIATFKSYGQDPKVAATAKDWKTFNDQTLDSLVASGRFDQSTIDQWKQGDYLSFYRIDPDSGAVGAPGGGSLSAPGKVVALKGSDKLIADPHENIVRNINALTSMAMKNEAMQRVARDGTNYGYMKPALKGAPNVVTVYEAGKPKRFQVTDPLLYDSVTASRMPVNAVMKLAAMPGNFLRESVTKAPPFWIRNMLRDSLDVWSKGYTPVPFLNIISGANEALREGPSFKALERLGVIGTGIRGEGGAAGTAENLRATMDPSTMSSLDKALAYIEDISRKSEAANRITVYDSVMKRTGGNEAQSSQEARELLNFSRHGANPIAQVLSALIPFQNARWQGFDVGARTAFGRGANPNMQRQFIARAMYMAGITSIYTALASQLPAWRNATEEERENSWFIPTGTGETIRVPVPFEFGFVAKIIPERLTAMMMGDEGGKELLGAFKRFVLSTMKVDYAPQAVAPLEEVRNNYDKFRNREIESPWMQKLEPNYRIDENTTEMAKSLAPYTNLSPVQLDHIIRGYMGSTGMYAVNLIDFLMRPESLSDVGDRKMSQMPVVGPLFQREDGARKLIEFYAIRDTAEQAANTLKVAQKARTPVEAAERERMGKLAQLERQTRKSDERMSMATRIERQIRADMKIGRLTPEQGRKTLEELRAQKLAIADPVVKLNKERIK